MILGVPEGPLALLDRTAHAAVVDLVLKLRELVGDVDFEVGRGRVYEHDVQIKVQQMRDRAEDLGGDALQRVEQEVHRRYAASSDSTASPSMATRSATHLVAASFEPGSSARWATSVNW